VLPTRQLLGGPILNKYADKVDSGDHAALKAATPPGSGKRVNFLSDAWENIAKTHILGVILSLVGLCVTFGTFTCGSRHDGLAIVKHLESILPRAGMLVPSSLTTPTIVPELDAS